MHQEMKYVRLIPIGLATTLQIDCGAQGHIAVRIDDCYWSTGSCEST
jgi:hypothetical protein